MERFIWQCGRRLVLPLLRGPEFSSCLLGSEFTTTHCNKTVKVYYNVPSCKEIPIASRARAGRSPKHVSVMIGRELLDVSGNGSLPSHEKPGNVHIETRAHEQEK
jgi:hypothetical protein